MSWTICTECSGEGVGDFGDELNVMVDCPVCHGAGGWPSPEAIR